MALTCGLPGVWLLAFAANWRRARDLTYSPRNPRVVRVLADAMFTESLRRVPNVDMLCESVASVSIFAVQCVIVLCSARDVPCFFSTQL